MQIEEFSTQSLQTVIPSYLYNEYSDDEDLQAFVATYNAMAQGYLDWFNQTPLALYTSPNINGALLDWIGRGIYNVARPAIGSIFTHDMGDMNARVMDGMAMNAFRQLVSGTSTPVSDDLYKRTLTWILYRGDGMQMTLQWLRRRVARFLYGSNGSDISLDELLNVSILQNPKILAGAMNTGAMNAQPMNQRYPEVIIDPDIMTIIVPNTPIGQQFEALFMGGFLPKPFQVNFLVQFQ